MQYITITRFKTKAICGEVNIPATSEIKLMDNVLYWNDKPICLSTSENAHHFFARNDDGEGRERGYLTREIKSILQKKIMDIKHDGIKCGKMICVKSTSAMNIKTTGYGITNSITQILKI